MKKALILSVAIAIALSFTLALSSNALAGGKATTITGTIHCIDSSGKMHVKAGVCPADHIGHILLTDDGRAIMLGGGEKMEAAVRNLNISAGTKVKIKGEMAEDLSAIKIEEIVAGVGAGG